MNYNKLKLKKWRAFRFSSLPNVLDETPLDLPLTGLLWSDYFCAGIGRQKTIESIVMHSFAPLGAQK